MKKITLIASALALMGLAGCAHMGPRPVQEPIDVPADQWQIGNCSTSACNQTLSYAMRINRYGPEPMPANILASHWETMAECAKTCAPNYAEIHDLLCKRGSHGNLAVFDNHERLFPVFLIDPAIDPATFLAKGHYDIYLNKLHCGGNAK